MYNLVLHREYTVSFKYENKKHIVYPNNVLDVWDFPRWCWSSFIPVQLSLISPE